MWKLLLSILAVASAQDDEDEHPVCAATRQAYHDTGCCGGEAHSVCVSPTLDVGALGTRAHDVRQSIGAARLATMAMAGATLNVYHSVYGYDRVLTLKNQHAGFVPEFLLWVHVLTGATVNVVNEWRSPETDLNQSDIFLGWKDIIPNRYESRAPHLGRIAHAAPTCAMRHYLIVRTVDKPVFAAILGPMTNATEFDCARALHQAGLRVATCNCEQYDLWRDPEYGFGVFNTSNSNIFGAPGMPGISDYLSQWTNRVSACTLDTPNCADWTFTSDHRDPYFVKGNLPENLEIIQIEMAVPSAQWIFYNDQKPHAAPLRAALDAIVDEGLFDFTFCRWKHAYVRSSDSDEGNPYANEARVRAKTIGTAPIAMDSQSVSFASHLVQGADLGAAHYTLASGLELSGYVERFVSSGGVAAAVASDGPRPPSPPPDPPAPPYVAPSPGDFCEECNFGFFETDIEDPFA